MTATPRSIVGAELDQRQLDRGERGRDVEHVEVADVADAEDLPLQLALAGRERDAVPVAQQEHELARVDRPRARGSAVTTAALSSSGENSSRPIAFDALAAGAAEADVALERRLEPLVEQDPERDVEPGDERDAPA